MKHVQAGVVVGGATLLTVLALTGLAHFVGGWSYAGIIIVAAVVVGIAAAVIDYLTEER